MEKLQTICHFGGTKCRNPRNTYFSGMFLSEGKPNDQTKNYAVETKRKAKEHTFNAVSNDKNGTY